MTRWKGEYLSGGKQANGYWLVQLVSSDADSPTSGAAMSWVGFGLSLTNADWLGSWDTSLVTRWKGENLSGGKQSLLFKSL